ncbi:MAG: Baseplate J-like protein [Chloroflexi bacterium]|nr:MAG: Baseplate J-like protein [Chloroflexota bacterium]
MELRAWTLRRILASSLKHGPFHREPARLLGAYHDSVAKSDDLQAIRARIDQSTVDHVVLRVPAGARALKSPLGMRRLRDHAHSRGIVLIIESRGSTIRALARAHGLNAVGSLRTRELYEGRLRSRRVGPGPLAIPIPVFTFLARATLSIAAVLALLASIVLLLPQTTVRIAPQLSQTTVTVPVQARIPQAGQPLPDGLLPARRFSTIVADLNRARSSGVIETPDTNARGDVLFTNLTGAPLNIAAGAIVSTAKGQSFRTRQAIVLGAAPDTDTDTDADTDTGSEQQSPTQTAEVEALTPGPPGNIPAGDIVQAEPGLAGRVQVVNPAALTGGTTRSARAPTPDDRDSLRAAGITRLQERGLLDLTALSSGAFVFHPDSILVTIAEERLDPPIGAVGADVELTLRGAVSVLGVDLTQLQAHAESALAAPQALAGFASNATVVPGSVTVLETSSAQYDPATGTIRFDMLVRGVVAPEIGESDVRSLVQWKSATAAEQIISQQFALRAPAQVRVSPGLMPRTSLFGFRVKVEIDLGANPQPTGGAASPTLANAPPR